MNIASVSEAQNVVVTDGGVGKKIVTCAAPPYANAIYITGLSSAGVSIVQKLGGAPVHTANESTSEPICDWWEFLNAPQKDYRQWLFLFPSQNVATTLEIEIEELGDIYVGFAQKAANPPPQIKLQEVRNIEYDSNLQIQTEALGGIVKINT